MILPGGVLPYIVRDDVEGNDGKEIRRGVEFCVALLRIMVVGHVISPALLAYGPSLAVFILLVVDIWLCSDRERACPQESYLSLCGGAV